MRRPLLAAPSLLALMLASTAPARDLPSPAPDTPSTGDASGVCVKAAGSTLCRPNAERFGETLSVLDFGVDMTGVKDSSAALTAALNSGQRLTAPCGVMRLVSRVVVSRSAQLQGGGACTLLKYDAPAGSPAAPLLDILPSAVDSYFAGLAFDHQNNTRNYASPKNYGGNLITGSMVLIQADRTVFERVTGHNGHDNCFAVAQINQDTPRNANAGRPQGVSMRTVRTFGCGTDAYKAGAGIDVASGSATVVDDHVDVGSSSAFILDIGAGAQGTFSNLTGIGTRWSTDLFAKNGTRSQTFYIGSSGSTFTNLVSMNAEDRGLWVDYFTDRNTYTNVQIKAPHNEAILWKARASTMTNLFIESPGFGQATGTKDGIVFDTTGGPIDAAHLIGVTFGNEANAARFAYVRTGTNPLRGTVIGSDTQRANALASNIPDTFTILDGTRLVTRWETFTPTVRCGNSGAPGIAGAQGRFRASGRTYDIQMSVEITGTGTCAGLVTMGLPAPAAVPTAFAGTESRSLGVALSALAPAGASGVQIRTFDGKSAAVAGYTLTIGGTYLAQ